VQEQTPRRPQTRKCGVYGFDAVPQAASRRITRTGEILLSDVGSQRNQVLQNLWRPDDVHVVDRFGTGRSRLRFQELIQLLTSLCETPSPRSNEAMARSMPATRHSFESRYSLRASAARNDRVRPVLFASFSTRFLTSGSTRTVKVIDGTVSSFRDRLCTM
jgi:hypothetical protein